MKDLRSSKHHRHQHLRRHLLLLLLPFLAGAALFTLTEGPALPPPPPLAAAALPEAIADALLHYALRYNSTHMSPGDLRSISTALRLRGPCNLLVFGLTSDSLLLRALNHGGRTVFLDESEFRVSQAERRHPSAALEAYGVAYTTRVRDLRRLLRTARDLRKSDCRPEQNLLYSDCELGINDLPNELYDVDWDVIVVDGPSGYDADSPGRVASVFTAAVMARSGGKGEEGRRKKVDVFVHEYERELERVSSEEFLCSENLVGSSTQLAHFVVESRKEGGGGGGGGGEEEMEFCIGERKGSSGLRAGDDGVPLSFSQ